MATVKRPAQGNNSGPLNRPSPAYLKPLAPSVVGSGSISHPKDTRWSGSTLKRLVVDATPKVIKL